MTVATLLRAAVLFALVAVVAAAPVHAQSTGKISGRVVDEAEAPIPGASVLVVDTGQGATTDADGYYTILNVGAGTYTLRISFIGYTPQVVEGVDVNISQTTTINATLLDETAQIDEVVVRAERPPVEIDVSNSRANINAEQIEALPVASVENVVQLQAGVQDGFVIRGSGADEIAFQVNGLTLRDERNNAPFTNISLSSVQEIQVQTGGFNAEYGNVRSGVVNVITKEGDPNRYEATVSLRYSPPAQKNFGGMANDLNSFWIRPYVDPEVAFVGTENGAWDAATRSQYLSFAGWNAISAGLLADADPSNDLTPQALRDAFLYQHRKTFEITDPDYDVDLGFGGPIPGVSRRLGNLRFYGSYRREQDLYLLPLYSDRYTEETGHLKVTSDVAPGMKLSFEGRLGSQTGTASTRTGSVATGQPSIFRSSTSIASQLTNVSYIDSRIFSGDYWGPSQTTYNQLGTTFSHSPSATSFYEVRFNRFASNYDVNPGPRRDTTDIVFFGGVGFDEAPFGWEPYSYPGINGTEGVGSGMRMGVGMSNARDSSEVAVYNLQADYTNQLTRFAEVKTGLEYNLTRSRINYAQIDSFLTSSNARTVWDQSPVRAAAYAQTKLELQGMIANVGLRADYFHAGGDWFQYGLFDPVFAGIPIDGSGDLTASLDTLLETSGTSRLLTLSPRLGVSFPVTTSSKLYFNYGHFRSLPDPDNLYLVRAFSIGGQVSRIADPNNPLPRTVAYELGFEQSFLNQFVVRLAGYYKDVSLEPRLVAYNSRDGRVTYSRSEPNRYSDIRGFEVTLSRNRGRWLQGFVNYTYDVRQTGYFGFAEIYENSTTQRQQSESDAIRAAALSRPIPRPYARANIDLLTPNDFGPSLAGLRLLGGWRTSFLGRWQDGGKYSYGDNGVPKPGVVNNVDVRDFWSLDLRFAREFEVAGRGVTFFADVLNALNRKALAFSGSAFYGAYDAADRNAYLTSLHLPASDDYTSNIPGADVIGDYRPEDVDYQPMARVQDRANVLTPRSETIYFENASQQYLVYRDGAWQPADTGRVQEVLDTKAYIDMPNQGFLNFLGPRDIFFGIRVNL